MALASSKSDEHWEKGLTPIHAYLNDMLYQIREEESKRKPNSGLDLNEAENLGAFSFIWREKVPNLINQLKELESFKL